MPFISKLTDLAHTSSIKFSHSRPIFLWARYQTIWGNLYTFGFPGSDGKESACNAEGLSSILGSGRSPGEGLGYPFQYSCLENSMDRGTWQAIVHGVAKNQT